MAINQSPSILVRRFNYLRQKKEKKIHLMRILQKHLQPKDTHLHIRGEEGTSSGDVLFDTTARNVMEDYTISSLEDIINPFDPWFSLDLNKRIKDISSDISEWSAKATEQFFIFVNDSNYYKCLIEDKSYYDSYGFSGMSFFLDRSKRKLRIKTEDPFNIIVNDESMEDTINEVYWVRYFNPSELKHYFNFEVESGQEYKHAVLCACVPNEKYYVDDSTRSKKKFVQLYFYLGASFSFGLGESYFEEGGRSKENINLTDHTQEIGERIYLDENMTVFTRDIANYQHPYGRGFGSRLLVQAQNLNQLRRDSLQLSAFIGNPPLEAPHDTLDFYKSFAPGEVYPSSYTGQSLNVLYPTQNLASHFQFIQNEEIQLREAVPNVQPPQKKARQSQFEIDRNFLESAKRSMIYKINYLKDGVSEHLKRMFKFAIELKVIDAPPEGVTFNDVQPNLSNILLKEFKKQKSQSYVQSLSLAQGFLTLDQGGSDNFDSDSVIRSIFIANGVGDALLSEEEVAEIRQQRLDAQQQQQQLALQQAQAQLALSSAQAFSHQASGQKSLADSEKEE